MSKHDQHVRVDNGKYTFVKIFETTSIQIHRHGQPWHEQQDAFNAIVSLMVELDAARIVVDGARRAAARLGDNAPVEIKDALVKHRSLVDDHEPPTMWAAVKLDDSNEDEVAEHVWVTVRRDHDATEYQIDACSRCGAERRSEWGTLPTFLPPSAERSCGL